MRKYNVPQISQSLPSPAAALRRGLPALIIVLSIVAALATASLMQGSPAHAEGGTTGISGAPASGAGPDGRSRFSYQVNPGQHVDDSYIVTNTGTSPQEITVFATDAFNTATGEFSLLNTVAKPSDGGSWIMFATGTSSVKLQLAAGQAKVVSFRLNVPAEASPGDHAGGIVASVASAGSTTTVDRRVATRMYVRVKGKIQAGLTVGSIEPHYSNTANPLAGMMKIRFMVRNDGNVALGATAAVGVRSFFGIEVGDPVKMLVPELLPRSTRIVSVTVPAVAALGYYNAYLSLAPVADPQALDPGVLRVTERDATLFSTPWWLIALAVLAGLVLGYLYLRRRQDRKNAAAWIDFAETEAAAEAAAEAEAATGSALETTSESERAAEVANV